MGIIAWILLGLAAGVLARRLLPGRKALGLALPCVTGPAGARSREPRRHPGGVLVTVPVRRHDAFR
jgi:hypothetical protein